MKTPADLSAKQIIAALMGPGLFVLALDSAVEHFVGKGGVDNKLQLIPAFFGPIAGALLIVLAIRKLRLSEGAVRLVLRAVGGLSTLVGLAGAVFHVLPLIEDLSDEELTRGALEGAIGSAPPLIAPLAFAAFGTLLVALASPRLVIAFRRSAEGAAQGAPIPIADVRRKAG